MTSIRIESWRRRRSVASNHCPRNMDLKTLRAFVEACNAVGISDGAEVSFEHGSCGVTRIRAAEDEIHPSTEAIHYNLEDMRGDNSGGADARPGAGAVGGAVDGEGDGGVPASRPESGFAEYDVADRLGGV